jgi:hypothetical protein
MAKPEVPNPSAQVAIYIFYLLLHTKRARVMDIAADRRPEPLLTPWTWAYQYQPCTRLSAPDIVEPEAEEVYAVADVQLQAARFLLIQS